MDSKYINNQTAHLIDIKEERFLRQQLVWAKKRMDLLALIEEKLKQARTLALYIVEHQLNKEEVVNIQVEVDDLLREVTVLSQEENQVYH